MALRAAACLAETFPTFTAARKAGFRERKEWEYSGEEVTVKGRLLVRNAKEAQSKSRWMELGFRVRKDATPHCHRSVYSTDQGRLSYDVFRDDQVEPKRKVLAKPPVLIDVLASVWVINRRAKRCRDQALALYKRRMHGLAGSCREEKDLLYSLKAQVLHHLFAEGRLKVAGHHRFPDGNWAELLQGDGFTFHRPCPPQQTANVEDRDEIDAKPKGAKEPRLKDALHTVKAYLENKPEVLPYRWPPKERAPARRRYEHRTEGPIDNRADDHEAVW